MRVAKRTFLLVLSVLLFSTSTASAADHHKAARGQPTEMKHGRNMTLGLENNINAHRTIQSDSTGTLSASGCCNPIPPVITPPGLEVQVYLPPYGPPPFTLMSFDWPAWIIGDYLVLIRPPGVCGTVPFYINFGYCQPNCVILAIFEHPNSFVVSSLDDAGQGSLRAAIDSANTNCGPVTISFAIAGTIQLLASLPPLRMMEGGTTLLGFTAPGASASFTPTIILDGSMSTPGPGLLLESPGNRIEGLTFRHFNGPGIAVTGASSYANTITGCRFYANAGPGIDLGNDGITPNDPGDVDTGPNTLLNYPVFDSVIEMGVDTFAVYGTSAPLSRVELFLAAEHGNSSFQPEATTNGPAYRLLRWTVADTAGKFKLDSIAEPEWSLVTATATDLDWNTSELALNKTLTPDPLRITAYSEPVPPLRSVMSWHVGSPALQVAVYSPPIMGHIDSIGPSFNTFGSKATYDSTADYNGGGLPDTRVKIAAPDTGEYRTKYVLIGDPGNYLTGIGIDGHSEIKKKIAFATMGQIDSATYYLAPPLRGELTGDGVFDVMDVLASIGIVFSGKPLPDPPELIDVNCDGVPDVLDVLRLINFVFVNGPAPCR